MFRSKEMLIWPSLLLGLGLVAFPAFGQSVKDLSRSRMERQKSRDNQDPGQPGSSKDIPQEEPPLPEPPRGASPTVEAGESAGEGSRRVRPILKPGTDQRKELQRLYKEAVQEYASIDNYIARLRRREQVGGKDHPEEVISLKFRKNPWSVMLKWVGKEGKGREVIYVKGHYGSKIHTLLAGGDNLIMPAGSRVALSPDSLLVRSASRHHITEVGIGAIIDKIGADLSSGNQNLDDRRQTTLTYLGETRRPEFTTPLEVVEESIPPKVDPDLDNGGQRFVFFDTSTHLPVLVITRNDRNQIVEYYCFDRFQFSVNLDDQDFNPDKLWQKGSPGKPKP